MGDAAAKTLQSLLDREAEGKASTVEPFITTARGSDANREFLVFEDGGFSYSSTFAQADAETNRLAQLLVAAGVKPGDVVSICFENSPQAVYAQLAVWKVGAGVAFLNFNVRFERDGLSARSSRAFVSAPRKQHRAHLPSRQRLPHPL
jgi:acyl-coenzyme A synthetase/AMP-(fatty) acid ligase